MELIRRFPAALLTQVLSEWAWLPETSGKTPLVVSPFGDVFLQGDDGVWFLDCLEGTITREWESPQALQAELNTPEGQDRYLMAGLALAVYNAGVIPGEDQVLTFKVPPVLGGPIDQSNIEAGDLAVAMAFAGQIHRQVNDLPPGTAITGITVDGQDP